MGLAEDLKAVLDDPTHMWRHALGELSPDSARLFLTLTFLPRNVIVDDLRDIFSNQGLVATERFMDSLKSIEDSFVTIDAAGDVRHVSFLNPSLNDFARTYVDQNTELLDVLVLTATRFEQIAIALRIAMATADGKLKYPATRQWVLRRRDALLDLHAGLLSAKPLQRGDRFGWSGHTFVADTNWLVDLADLALITGGSYGPSASSKIDAHIRLTAGTQSPFHVDLLITALTEPRHRTVFNSIAGESVPELLRESLMTCGDWKYTRLAKIQPMLDDDPWRDDTWIDDCVGYCRQKVTDLEDSSDYDELAGAVRELEQLAKDLDLDLGEEIDILEQLRDEAADPSPSDFERTPRNSAGRDTGDSWAAVDDLFSSLLE